MKEYLLDANVLLRFLVQDDASQSPASTALFKKAERREINLHLDPVVIAEAVYVLAGHYDRDRAEVANILLSLLQNPGIVTDDQDSVVDSLQRYALFNVDYADAWLAARSARLHHPVASFDRDFDKFQDIKRYQPKT